MHWCVLDIQGIARCFLKYTVSTKRIKDKPKTDKRLCVSLSYNNPGISLSLINCSGSALSNDACYSNIYTMKQIFDNNVYIAIDFTFFGAALIGASLSEPHTSRVNEIPSIYIYIYIDTTSYR